MGLKTRDVLTRIKTEIESITPVVGNVYSTLRSSATPTEIDADYRFKDPKLGNVYKAFIVKPGPQRINRASLGPGGFSKRDRTVVVEGFVTIRDGNDGSSDAVLEDAFDDIIGKLQLLQRLEDKSQGDTFFPGIMELSPMTAGRVSNHKVVVAELTAVIQDRLGGAC